MTKKEKGWLRDSRRVHKYNYKKIMIVVGLSMIVAGVFSLGYFMFAGQLATDEVTWEQEHGDIYYLGVFDDYYDTDRNDDDDYIRSFRTTLKSEILEKKDLSSDWDDDDDLIIMSSFLFGMEDYYYVELPNWFDIYTVLANGYNIFKMGEPLIMPLLDSSYLPEFTSANYTDMVQWALPNAIHIQHSSPYHLMNSLVNQYNLHKLGQFEGDIETLEDLLFSLMFYETDYYGDFEGDVLLSPPENFTVLTAFPDDNNATVITDPSDSGNQVLQLFQDQGTKDAGQDNLFVNLNMFDYLNETEFGSRVNISDYWYNVDSYSYDVESLEDNNEHDLEMSLKSDDFNISVLVNDEFKDFEGFNGVDLKISDGTLYYSVGDYIYDQTIGKFRATLEHERGWFSTGLSLSSIYYDGSPYGERFNTYVSLHNSGLPTERNYASVRIDGELGGVFDLNVPYHIDCPHNVISDSGCFDYNSQSNRIFRWNNFTNLAFNVSSTEASEKTLDLIDNIMIEGSPIYQTIDFESIVQTLVYNQLFYLSTYHTLFYPNEFSWDTIAGAMGVLNVLFEEFIGISDFVTIENGNSELKLEISYNTFDNLRDLVAGLLLDVFNLKEQGLIEGDTDVKLQITFDKDMGVLKESYFTFRYNELDITRELGIKLVGACRFIDSNDAEERIAELEAESDDHQDEIEELQKGQERIYDDYPTYPDKEGGWVIGDDMDETIQKLKDEAILEYLPVVIVALAITVGISILGSLGVAKLIKKLKARKLEP